MSEPRITKHRGKYVIYENLKDGRTSRRSLGTSDKLEAERRFADYKASILAREVSNGFTVAQLWQKYLLHLNNRPIVKTMEFTGRAILPVFGHKAPHQITLEDSRTYALFHRAKSPSTIHNELNHLRSTLRWAFKHNLITFVPFIELPTPRPPRAAYITKTQAKTLLASLREPHLRLFVTLALTTGARNTAILELTWDRVDLDTRMIQLRTEDMSHRKGRATVPINDTALTELLRVPEEHRTGHVIQWRGHKVGRVNDGLKATAQSIGLGFISPHVFRHSAAVWMVEDEIPMEEIAQFLGHANVSITRKVYARYSPTYLRKAATALEF